MPAPIEITGRSSSIPNAFINSIIPVVSPGANEVKQAMEIPGMTFEILSFGRNGVRRTDPGASVGLSEFLSRLTLCKVDRGTGQKTTATGHWMAASAASPPSHRHIKAGNAMKGA
jgi:hypothetical protein